MRWTIRPESAICGSLRADYGNRARLAFMVGFQMRCRRAARLVLLVTGAIAAQPGPPDGRQTAGTRTGSTRSLGDRKEVVT